MGDINLITIFTTGLLAGGLTCMAVQGGLLATTIAQKEQERLLEKVKGEGLRGKGNALSIIVFLIAKLVAHTALGFLLGWLGSLVKLSLPVQVGIQIGVAVFMIGIALNMLNVHPLFRYFAIQPPHFLGRIVRKQSKSRNVFAPAILGAFTVFIPCGTTQAMMALAIASGKSVIGAAILSAFVLGTSPVFFLLGYLTTRLGEVLHERFMKVAATAIILLAVFNLNNAVALTGSGFTIDKVFEKVNCTISFCSSPVQSSMAGIVPTDFAVISISNAGYTPNFFAVTRSSTVTIKLINNGSSSCAQAFTIPQLGIQKIVPLGGTENVTFTAPDKPGDISFMCSMGMYRGTIRVI